MLQEDIKYLRAVVSMLIGMSYRLLLELEAPDPPSGAAWGLLFLRPGAGCITTDHTLSCIDKRYVHCHLLPTLTACRVVVVSINCSDRYIPLSNMLFSFHPGQHNGALLLTA